MPDLTRREFARIVSRTGFAIPFAGGLLAACGGDSKGGAAAAGGDAAQSITMPRVALTSPVQPSYVNILAGPITYGPDFGLKASKSDFTTFESHQTASQAALAGKADIIGGSTVSNLALISRGAPYRIFAPFQDLTDLTIVARGQVKELSDLKNPSYKVAIDDPGGAAMAAFDSILIAQNAGFMSDDIPNKVILGSSGLRATALAAGQADATILQSFEAPPIDAKTHDVNILANVYSSAPKFLMQSFAASEDWLKKNPATAAAFVASIVKANQELVKSYDTYNEAVQQFIDKPPAQKDLKTVFGVIQKYEFWPKDGGLNRDKLTFMIDLGVKEKIFAAGTVDADGALDTTARDQAMTKLAS